MKNNASIPRPATKTRTRDAAITSCQATHLGLAVGVLCLSLTGGCGSDRNEEQANREPAAQAVVHLPPAPKPTGPLPPDAACATPECHSRFLSDALVHEPMAGGVCTTCHEPDVGGHTYPLIAEGDTLCRDCHETGTTGLWRHQVLDNEGCLACHDAHRSTGPFLLSKTDVDATCENCHLPSDGRSKHAPYATGECGACHEPHESDFAGLLRGGEGAEHCRLCHERETTVVKSAAFAHRQVEGGCLACHGAHATKHDHLLTESAGKQCLSCHTEIGAALDRRITHDAVLTGKRCLSCHDPHGSNQPMMVRDEQVTVCLECHDKTIRAADGRTIPDMSGVLEETEFIHGAVRIGDCSACHSVHGAEYERLLQLPAPAAIVGPVDIRNYALCFSCHDPELALAARTTTATQFRNGNVNLHVVHIQSSNGARTCTSCHAVHGSDHPRHIADAVRYQGSDWLMPIGFELHDAGGSCAPGCHEPLSYSRDNRSTPGDESEGGVP